MASVAAFRIDWDDMQLNVPNPFVPAQFYIANVGGARSSGVEVDVTARPRASDRPLCARRASRGARFNAGSFSSGVDVSGNGTSRTRPSYTDVARRAALTQDDGPLVVVLRARGRGVLRRVPLRRGEHRAGRTPTRSSISAPASAAGAFVAEAWMRNAFDTRYVPVAFAYPGSRHPGSSASPATRAPSASASASASRQFASDRVG